MGYDGICRNSAGKLADDRAVFWICRILFCKCKSFEEYNQEFQEYYNLVMNSSAGTSQALEALNTAKQELEEAQKQVEAAVWAIEQAKQKQAEASAKMQQKQQEINNNTQAVQEAQEKLAQAQQKHSQSAEANAAAHTAVEKAEKEAQEALQAVKTQQQAVDQAQNELNLVQASQEEKQKITIMHLQR